MSTLLIWNFYIDCTISCQSCNIFICVGHLGSSVVQVTTVTSTNEDLLPMGPLVSKVHWFWIKIHVSLFMKLHLKISSAKWQQKRHFKIPPAKWQQFVRNVIWWLFGYLCNIQIYIVVWYRSAVGNVGRVWLMAVPPNCSINHTKSRL